MSGVLKLRNISVQLYSDSRRRPRNGPTFLNTPYAGGRHQPRLDKITAMEEEEKSGAAK
jgi:hypothetical protein